jgi:hypothetical protein
VSLPGTVVPAIARTGVELTVAQTHALGQTLKELAHGWLKELANLATASWSKKPSFCRSALSCASLGDGTLMEGERTCYHCPQLAVTIRLKCIGNSLRINSLTTRNYIS